MRRKQSTGFTFDFLAPELKLNMLGKAANHTKVGMIMSIACLCIFLTVLSIILMDYLDTTKPRVSQEIQSLTQQPLIDFVKDKHFPIMSFYFQDIYPITTTEELSTFAHVFMIKSTYYEPDVVGDPITPVYEQYDIVPCSELIDRGSRDTYAFQSDDPKETERFNKLSFCFDNKNGTMRMGGENSKKGLELIELRMYPCVLGAQCRNLTDLNQLSYSVINPTAVSNFGKKKDPISHETTAENYEFINFVTYPVHKLNLMRAEIYEDQGFLSSKSVSNQYTVIRNIGYASRSREVSKITCTLDEVDQLLCSPYFIQEFSVSKSILKVEREYKGIVESLSDVGGIMDLIFLIFYSVYGLYNGRVTDDLLVKKIYGVEKPTKKKTKSGSSSNSVMQDDKKQMERKEEKYKRAKDAVYNVSLDIIEIAKEINRIKFIGDLLLTPEISNQIPEILIKSAITNDLHSNSSVMNPQNGDNKMVSSIKKRRNKGPLKIIHPTLGDLRVPQVDDLLDDNKDGSQKVKEYHNRNGPPDMNIPMFMPSGPKGNSKNDQIGDSIKSEHPLIDFSEDFNKRAIEMDKFEIDNGIIDQYGNKDFKPFPQSYHENKRYPFLYGIQHDLKRVVESYNDGVIDSGIEDGHQI